jgi:iron complex outermembrane receptor protein
MLRSHGATGVKRSPLRDHAACHDFADRPEHAQLRKYQNEGVIHMLSDRNRSPLRATVRAVLGLAALSAAAWGASAQQTTSSQGPVPDETLEEIVVTGYRQSLNVALEGKRDSVGSVDAIVAEDIADFPDLNLAEAIQRIPGVSIQRDAGEGRQITVRGLGPEFTRVRLNGMEAMSANGGTDAAGGTNRARNFDFNTFASELFNSITVRKTASADTEEGSLGATVDLRTGRPFDYEGFTVVTSVQGSYNDLAEDVDPRAALLVSNTWADGKFGALVSVAYTERRLIDEGASDVRWARPAGGFNSLAPGYAGTATLAQLNNAFAPRIPRYDHYEHEQDRLGLTASLQFAPTDTTWINLDALYAKFQAERREIFLEIPNFSSAANGMRVQDAVIDGNNSIVYGVFNNVDIRSEQRFDELETEFTQVSLDGTQKLTDKLSLNAYAGYAKSDHENPVQTTLLFDWNNSSSLTYDFRGNDRVPLLTFGTTDVTSDANGNPTGTTAATSTTNSNGWFLSQIRMRPQTAVNTFHNYLADLEWEISDVWHARVGAQQKKFEFVTTELRRDPSLYCPPGQLSNANAEGCIPTTVAATPIASYSSVFGFGGDIGIPAGATTRFLLPDLNRAAGLFNLNDRSVFPLIRDPALNNNRTVEEEDRGVFAQVDMNSEIFGRKLRGNVGVRYVETQQTTLGFTFLSGSAAQIKADREYDDTLPSLNLALDLTDEIVLRASAAKVMSRPALGTLTPGGTVNVSGNNRVATLGNPLIDPTRAKAYDLAFEWYFAPESLVSVALFYKDIQSRPQGISLTSQVFTGNPFGIPDNVAVAACGTLPNCSPDLPIWTFNTTVNGKGGVLKGFELSYQQPFTFLPGFFSNFGAILNYTGVESEINYVNPITVTTDKADLTGLSKSAYNATVYYEVERFGARVSLAYRDEFLDPVSGVPGRDGNNLEGVDESLTVDASARFSLTDSIDLTLEALNLTDEFQLQWVDDAANRTSFYHHTGRSYLLGARIKF